MKRMLILAGLSGTLIPALASAELNYNAIDAGYSTTRYSNGNPNLTEIGIGFTRNYFERVYLGAYYGSAYQATYAAQGENRVHKISLGAGYHKPLMNNVDVVVAGHIVFGTANWGGNSSSANGYDVGAGVRALFLHGIEGNLAVINASKSNGTYYSNSYTYIGAQFGFYFTQLLEMTAGIDFKKDQTTSLGLRFYY